MHDPIEHEDPLSIGLQDAPQCREDKDATGLSLGEERDDPVAALQEPFVRRLRGPHHGQCHRRCEAIPVYTRGHEQAPPIGGDTLEREGGTGQLAQPDQSPATWLDLSGETEPTLATYRSVGVPLQGGREGASTLRVELDRTPDG